MPKDMSSARYKRLMKIIALLQSKRRVTREELEEAGQYSFEKKKKGYEQNRTLAKEASLKLLLHTLRLLTLRVL